MKERLSYFRHFITLRKQHKYNLLEKYSVVLIQIVKRANQQLLIFRISPTLLFKRAVMYM